LLSTAQKVKAVDQCILLKADLEEQLIGLALKAYGAPTLPGLSVADFILFVILATSDASSGRDCPG
jgi:hypothetical protein